MITAVIGIVSFPWKLYEDVGAYIFTWLVGYGSLLAAFAAVMIVDYWILRKTRLDVEELYKPRGPCTRSPAAYNCKALVAVLVGVIPVIPGFLTPPPRRAASSPTPTSSTSCTATGSSSPSGWRRSAYFGADGRGRTRTRPPTGDGDWSCAMDFGVTFQTDPPASAGGRAHAARRGSSASRHAWTFDSHILWQEPYVIYAHDARGDRADRGRAVRDQPGHARPHGHRVAVRHAQRHVRQPHDLRHRPRRLLAPRARQEADHARADRAGDRTSSRSSPRGARSTRRRATSRSRGCATAGSTCGWPATARRRSRCAGRKADGFILQLADPAILEWTVEQVRAAAAEAGRDPRLDHDLRRGARLRRRRPRPRARAVPLVRRDGRQPRRRPRQALRRGRRRSRPR